LDPFDIRSEVEVSSNGARRIRGGHLWVYSGDVTAEPPHSDPPLVRVVDSARNCLGYALFSRHSRIRLRLFSRDTVPPTIDFLRDRVKAAVARRAHMLAPTRACRLVNAEADLLPSIVVDRYSDWLVLQTLSRGAEALKEPLVEVLREIVSPRGILERNDFRARRLEGLAESRSALWGEIPDRVQVDEGGVRFEVDLMGGQKTGLFLDQSENRIAARNYARGTALDCFTNTGGFALHFARTCDSVIGIDVSARCIEQAERNARLNSLANIVFQEANVFDYLRHLERGNDRFDVICLDPPAFAKNKSSLAAAKGGYKEINLRAIKLLQAGGILVTSSCSYHLSEVDFQNVIAGALSDARRYAQILARRSQASDHPFLATMPETHYLKCWILRVL